MRRASATECINITGRKENDMPDIIQEDGSFVEGWHESYDESFHPTLSRIKTFSDLVTSHMDTKKKLGEAGEKLGADPSRVLIIPGDNASDTVKAEFYRRLGVPDDPDGYKYERNPKLSDKIAITDDRRKVHAKIAKKWGLTNKQFNGLLNDNLSLIDEDIAAYEKDAEETAIQKAKDDEEAARQEYENGNNEISKLFGEDKDTRLKQANDILKAYAQTEIKNLKGEVTGTVGEKLFNMFPKLENSPWMVMLIDRIAQDFGEDKIGKLTSGVFTTPKTISAQLDELRDSPENAFYDKSHPKHKEIMERRDALIKKLQKVA